MQAVEFFNGWVDEWMNGRNSDELKGYRRCFKTLINEWMNG